MEPSKPSTFLLLFCAVGTCHMQLSTLKYPGTVRPSLEWMQYMVVLHLASSRGLAHRKE